MVFLSALGAGVLFALACNLDTVLAAVARGTGLRLREDLLVAAVTTAVTYGSLALGALGGSLLPTEAAERMGGTVLALLGCWCLADFARGKREGPPEKGQGWLPLSLALAVNNAGVGAAAGVTGLSPLLASGCNFVVTLAALALGRRLGQKLAGMSRWALPASGVLLILLGVWQLF